MEAGTIHWPASTEETGYGHVTPPTRAAMAALAEVRGINPGIHDAPLFPDPKNPDKPVDRWIPRHWWMRAERLAGLERTNRRGWHSLRRKFASDLVHQPLKILSQLGGWKNPQTILICCQHPDQQQLREALADRRKAGNPA